MLLAPSDIHFLWDATCALSLAQPDSRLIAELSTKVFEKGELPKIQVAAKDGSWFALNNTYLHVFRELERQGKCMRIKVDVVPLTKVPQNVQKGMLVISEPLVNNGGPNNPLVTNDHPLLRLDNSPQNVADTDESDPSRVTKRGYHKLPDTTDEIVRAPVEPDIDSSSYSDYSDCDLDDEDTDSEFDEALTCNVCDRSFASTRLLAQHQQKKRHFGCSVCDSIFPNLMTLEHHKEALDHWSEDEGNTHDSESDGDDSDDEDGGLGSGEKAEEKERLL